MVEISETVPQQQPEFDGGTFVINYLSKSPEGFSVQSVNALRRHEPNTPLPQARRIMQKRKGEKKDLRIGEHFTPKLGVRNVTREGDTLFIDTKLVTFPTFMAINNPTESAESLDVSNPTGTALILLTTEPDGKHKMVFQHRSEKNRLYGDIPGASVAGYLDAVMDRRRERRGTSQDVTTETIKRNIIREMGEEIGLSGNEITNLAITGLAADKVKIHNEFLLLGTTSLSAEQLGTRIGDGDYFKFSEKFFTVDSSSENIEKLLTQVKCPLPHTHTAAFLAAGYLMEIRGRGIEAADEWKKRVTEGVKRNYQEIDNLVKTYYQENPDELNNIPDGKPVRNPNGYEPAYLPTEQGLPDVVSELKRVGLLQK